MLVILCEDSAMGKDFWSAINIYCLDGQAKVLTSNGVDKMSEKIKSVNLSTNDKVIFAIDNIGDSKVRSILRSLKNDAKNRGYSFKISSYYCIEEVFLSFVFFPDWLRLSDDVRKDIWKPIFEFVTGKSSFDYSKDDIFRARFPKDNNREQLANSYLNILTYNRKNGLANSDKFWIHKSGFGSCWYESCQTGDGVPYICNRKNYICYLYEQGYNFTSGEKLEYFWNNSILVNTVFPLSVIKKAAKKE